MLNPHKKQTDNVSSSIIISYVRLISTNVTISILQPLFLIYVYNAPNGNFYKTLLVVALQCSFLTTI